MALSDLVRALLAGDLLASRQWVADARRARVSWPEWPKPEGLDERELIVAAAVVELLAARDGAAPPAWTASVAGTREPLFLDPGLESMPRTLARVRAEAPEPLRKRNVFASADFLDVR